MKLEKKTIYRVDTRKKYEALMNDAYEQGMFWYNLGDAKDHMDCWDTYEDQTCVRIDNNGYMMFADVECYKDFCLDYKRVDYKITPKIQFMDFGAVCIDAPTYKEAYQALTNYINNPNNLINVCDTKAYTVRVQDNRTTVITPEGHVGVAHCHPDDEFDVVEGFRVAMEKIEEANRKLSDEELRILQALETLGCDEFDLNIGCEVVGCADNEHVCNIDLDDGVFDWLDDYKTYNIKALRDKYC